MKLYRNVLILVVVLAVAIGGYFLVKQLKTDTSDPTDVTQPERLDLCDSISLDLVKFKIENPNGSFEFIRKDQQSNWEVVSPADLVIDTDKVNSIANRLLPVYADKEIADATGQDLSIYGLDDPATVEFTFVDGTMRTFLLGNFVDTGYAAYLMERGGGTIYTIGGYKAEGIMVSRLDARSDALFSFNPADITGISMDKSGAAYFSAKKQAVADAVGSDWRLDYPVIADADKAAMDVIIQALSKNTTAEYVEDNATDLAKYGLENPAYAFGIELPTGRIKLLLGYEDKQAYRIYAKLDNDDDIFMLPIDSFTFLDKPLKELVSRFVYIVNIVDVNRIVVDIDGRTTVCGIKATKDDPDSDVFTVDGKDATMKDEKGNQPFRKYYQSLIGATLDDLELEASPEGQSEITITFYLKTEPGVVKVEFIPKNENYYYAMLNGVYTGMVIEKRIFDQADGIRNTYTKLMEYID